MVEQVAPTSTRTDGGFKNFVIAVLTGLLLTGGLLATFTDYLKDLFKNNTTTLTCNLTLKSGPNKVLQGITVKIHSGKKQIVDTTDDNGTVIFPVKKSLHKILFMFENKLYVRNCSIVSDTAIVIDIAATLTNVNTGEVVKSPSAQPDKKIDQKKIGLPPNAVKITATQKDNSSSSIEVAPPVRNDEMNVKGPLSANDILNELTLEVKIDKNDSYKNRSEQFAYHYYMAGRSELLDHISQVNYQRNHSTFAEFKSNRFNVSEDRSSNFAYVGYQWGSIPSAYVQIILKNGQESDVFLKTIAYK